MECLMALVPVGKVTVRPATVALVIASLVLLGCVPPVSYQPRFGLPACNTQLPGTGQLEEIDTWRVQLVCEQRDQWTPWWAEGYFDGQRIHIYPKVNPSEPDAYVLKVAAHEFGHWWGEVNHPEELAGWAAWRGLSYSPEPNGEIPAHEDFAESWAYCNFGWTPGASFVFWAGFPTSSECSTMRAWHG